MLGRQMKSILTTARTEIREFVESDAPAFHRLGSDPEIVRLTADPGGGFRDADHALEVLRGHTLADYEKHGFGRWAVVLRDQARIVGFCGLKHLDELGEIDLGYRFFPEVWGRGLATETGRAVLVHGFDALGLPEIIALALPENRASIRVMQKLGMRGTGRIDLGGTEAVRYVIRPEDL
jgi:RimJ/RimL family protein N-acetyltransferase